MKKRKNSNVKCKIPNNNEHVSNYYKSCMDIYDRLFLFFDRNCTVEQPWGELAEQPWGEPFGKLKAGTVEPAEYTLDHHR